MQRRILVLFVDNNPGVLTRISLLFSQKGFNILSITASITCVKNITRITIETTGDNLQVEQIIKQTSKLIEVHSVFLLDNDNSIIRDLLLVKVEVNYKNKAELCDITNRYGGKILDIAEKSVIVEITDTTIVIDNYLDELKGFKILELSRTGVTALERGDIIPKVDGGILSIK